MARAIWKGAISFGLVHIPVALQSAVSSQGIDFDWLDERTMDPVGYKRINKVTGKEVASEHIVKGIQYEKGSYVILTEEEIRTAHPTSTQTVNIFSFVDREEIPLVNIETPYYLAPDRRGEKVYALLRETLRDTNKVALANIILHTREHLAALMPIESALVLVLLRWPNEVRSLASMELDKTATNEKFTKAEKDMAKRLVSDMAGHWQPDEYRDNFHDKIMALVDKKARNNEIENVEAVEGGEERKSADIIDLTELLRRSLGGGDARKSTTKKTTSNESKRATTKTKSSTSKTTAEKSTASKTKGAGSKSTATRTSRTGTKTARK